MVNRQLSPMSRGKASAQLPRIGERWRQALREGAPPVVLPPAFRRHDGKANEERHLEPQEQQVADRQAGELARRLHRPVDVQDHRVVQEAVDPHPARSVGDPVVYGEPELPRLRHVIPLAPEVELVHADDEEDAQRQINQIVRSAHRVVPVNRRSRVLQQGAQHAEEAREGRQIEGREPPEQVVVRGKSRRGRPPP